MMIDPITNDSSFYAARKALDGLSRRQEQIGQNLANVDTPDYRAKNVTFEPALRQALSPSAQDELDLTLTRPMHLPVQESDSASLTQVSLRCGGSVRADGNNVDIDVELTQATETELRYETLTQLVNKKFSLLKQIASSR